MLNVVDGLKIRNKLERSNYFLLVLSLPVWRGDKKSSTNFKDIFISKDRKLEYTIYTIYRRIEVRGHVSSTVRSPATIIT
jgi:hypothetical protein